MSDLFRDYPLAESTGSFKSPYDEMLAHGGSVRSGYDQVHKTLKNLSATEVASRADALARSYVAQGVTFDYAGEERPFPLDVVPRVIEPKDWDHISSGVSQRVKALEAFLADVYGPQKVVKDGVVPLRLVMSSAEYKRAAAGINPANGVRCHVSGIDIVRDAEGVYRVLEDNVRTPSGVSYVIANRQAMVRGFPELFHSIRVRPVSEYPQRLLAALIAAAPEGVPHPTVVVLTPGVHNSAYFEHTLLARLMGVELVEGRDLYCSNGLVYMRTTQGPRRVDVIYRRVDDEFLDPVQFREDSMLGVPGLLSCVRRGKVTLANAIGNGVADDKLTYTYVPDLIRYYLDEEPILKNVDTWRLEDPLAREEVLDRLPELVVKPVDGSGGKGIVVGPAASAAQLDAARKAILNDPRGWIAQPVVQLSTSPTFVDGVFRPRHIDLRPFAVNNGEDVFVLPGGLTRVALPEGQLIVNSSQGGGSKDTWVLEGRARRTARGGAVTGETVTSGTSRWGVAQTGQPFSMHPSDSRSEQQQQQQQQIQLSHSEQVQLRMPQIQQQQQQQQQKGGASC